MYSVQPDSTPVLCTYLLFKYVHTVRDSRCASTCFLGSPSLDGKFRSAVASSNLDQDASLCLSMSLDPACLSYRLLREDIHSIYLQFNDGFQMLIIPPI